MTKQAALTCCVAICLLVGSMWWFSRQMSTIKQDDLIGVYGVDLAAYHAAARLVLRGAPLAIYAPEGSGLLLSSGRFYEAARDSGYTSMPTRFIYLPLFASPFLLTARCSFETVASLWLALNLIMAAAAAALQLRLTRGLPHPLLRAMLILIINLISFPLFYALKLGQTTLVMYCMLCFLYFLAEKRHDSAAGVLLGIIVCLKLSPLVFCAYYLLTRRYRLVCCCLITAAALVLLSVLVYGAPLHLAYLASLQDLATTTTGGWSNQSIDAFVLRTFCGADPDDFALVASPDRLTAIKALTAVLAGTALRFACRRRCMAHIHHREALEFSAVIAALLLLPHLSWQHYFVFAALPAALALRMFFGPPGTTPKVIAVLMLLSYVLLSLPPLSGAVVPGSPGALLKSLPFLGACCMLGVALAGAALLPSVRTSRQHANRVASHLP